MNKTKAELTEDLQDIEEEFSLTEQIIVAALDELYYMLYNSKYVEDERTFKRIITHLSASHRDLWEEAETKGIELTLTEEGRAMRELSLKSLSVGEKKGMELYILRLWWRVSRLEERV